MGRVTVGVREPRGRRDYRRGDRRTEESEMEVGVGEGTSQTATDSRDKFNFLKLHNQMEGHQRVLMVQVTT